MPIDSTRKNRFRSTGLARSAAALAVGATALGSAQAGIIYSGVQDIAVNTSAGYPGDAQGVDLDFSGDAEFRWAGGQFDPMSSSLTGQTDQHTDGFAVIGNLPNPQSLVVGTRQFAAGFEIGPGGDFQLGKQINRFYTSVGSLGEWDAGETAYFGFQFTPASTPLYGWGQVSFDGTYLTLMDWAYEDTGASITAGHTGVAAAPVPGSTALLALGLSLAGCFRRRR